MSSATDARGTWRARRSSQWPAPPRQSSPFWGLLSWSALLEAIRASGPADPRVTPFLFLVSGVLELVALPLGSALSRRWEREADRFSLELTRDPEAFEAAHRRLARANLADLDPPRAVYALFFSHPTPPERITAARTWARAAETRTAQA